MYWYNKAFYVYIMWYWIPQHTCSDGRVVKALDLKSNGVSPRRFKSCSLRLLDFKYLFSVPTAKHHLVVIQIQEDILASHNQSYTVCANTFAWENTDKQNGIHKCFTCLLLPFVIGYTYTCSSFPNSFPCKISHIYINIYGISKINSQLD